MSAAIDPGAELARSLDESLAKILTTELLLAATAEDWPLDGATLAQVRELGIDLISLSEEAGGLGIGVGERARLAAVFGRRLVPAALRDEAFGLAPALAALGIAKERPGAVALVRPDGPPVAAGGGAAEQLVTLGAAAISLYEVGSGGPTTAGFVALDAGQGLARFELGDVDPVAAVDGPEAVAIRREYELMLVCEAFGAGERCLESAVEYAGQRRQFGREIAGFQAVAHQLAEAKLGLEVARAGIGRYVDLVAEDASAAMLADHLAVLRRSVPAAAREACEISIQVHGGIGFSWELGIHLAYRRILADQYLLGGEGASAEAVGTAYLERRRE